MQARAVAVAALLSTAIVHFALAPGHFRHQRYLGAAFFAFATTTLALAAALTWRPTRRAWSSASGCCALALLVFVWSRTHGLPPHADDVGNWWSEAGSAPAVIAELTVLGVGLSRLYRVSPRVVIVAAAGLGALISATAATAAAPHSQTSAHAGHGGHGAGRSADESHLGAEGLQLVAATESAQAPAGTRCPRSAPERRYEIAALAVDIPLNRWGDHDPQGRAFVLQSDVDAVRADEARYAMARSGSTPVPVSVGLQNDRIQPLTLRVLAGECLRIVMRNDLSAEAVALHLHGAALEVGTGGRAAIPGEGAAIVKPGQSREYVWAVPATEPEGSHYFHSSGGDSALGRQQTAHGLYGAVVVEPPGARWIDPTTGNPLSTGWSAVVLAPGRKAFREFALYYAEVGDETYQPLDRHGAPLPQAESLSGAYRPGGRAINYRSEPFFDRLMLQKQKTGQIDDSLSYSSYTFGDPATPMMRSYLGDPTVQRLVHAGTETAHVHHVHGGATRWPRQPEAGTGLEVTGLNKHPALLPGASERTDSQSIQPSETYDIRDECGAGGCQQSVGDFMFHCHIAHHYFAGMWGLWRVYNTLQDGPHSTDQLPVLRALPDRPDLVRPGVDSAHLVGAVVAKATDLKAWLERELPPAGIARGYDAGVWNWTLRGLVALGEPEDSVRWANYASSNPGKRPALLFDPVTGKPAYPMLHPHFGRRPPFAPGHGPAPYLDPVSGPDLPAPGQSGAASVCPSGTHPRQVPVEAIEVPVPLNAKNNVLDPDGKLFVLRSQEAAIRADPDLRRPLTLRANAGEDCLDVTLTNGMTDASDPHGFSKVSMHVHFVQFDVQASDGVDGGFNYEQTVRPYAADPATVMAAAPTGAMSILVSRPPTVGEFVGIGMGRPDGFEVVQVSAVVGDQLTLSRPLKQAHAAGELVSAEFVRYRWYPDVQVGTAFFHDHVNAILGQPHGLYGGLVVEPPGSSYFDPVTGKALSNGPVADIHTTSPTSVDVTGSFRELVTYLGDDAALTAVGRDTGGTLNLRVEPIAKRPDLGAPFLGAVQTPSLSAYLGDPVVFRALVGASNEVHTFHLDGHGFRVEPWSVSSPLVSTVPIGISERYDLSTFAGGPRRQAGDYLFGNGRLGKLESGSWGVLRVLPGPVTPTLQSLPNAQLLAPQDVCPARSEQVIERVTARRLPLSMLGGEQGIVLQRDATQAAAIRPLVLHIRSGDCLKIDFTNATDRGLSLHADLLAQDAGAAAVGRNPKRTTLPGASRTYTFYADPSIKATVAQLRDGLDPVHTLRLGMYGAVVVDPPSSRVSRDGDGVGAVVRRADGSFYRDFTVFLHDGDQAIGTHRMPYTKVVDGVTAISYGNSSAGSSLAAPILSAYAGDDVLLHVVAPASEQVQVFTLDGHTWASDPGTAGAAHVSAAAIGGMQSLNLSLDGGAGGRSRLAGDYHFGNARLPYDVAGMWGVLHVLARAQHSKELPQLPSTRHRHLAVYLVGGLVGFSVIGAAVASIGLRRRRYRY